MVFCDNFDQILIKTRFSHLLHHVFIKSTVKSNFIDIKLYFEFDSMCFNAVLHLPQLLLNVILSIFKHINTFISSKIVSRSKNVCGNVVHAFIESLGGVFVILYWVNLIISKNWFFDIVDVNQIDIKRNI
jgi:hypothetical protein